MSKIHWDSQLYLRYERERTQPSIDLASRIDLDSPAAIIDLGCGPGNSTRVLRERWPAAHITGLDSSTAMIEKARQTSDTIDWRIGDIQTWYEPNRFDLIFANASLHWIDDHETIAWGRQAVGDFRVSDAGTLQSTGSTGHPQRVRIAGVEITPASRPIHAPHSHTGRIL
jgi:SAM-dependent methyltransferase